MLNLLDSWSNDTAPEAPEAPALDINNIDPAKGPVSLYALAKSLPARKQTPAWRAVPQPARKAPAPKAGASALDVWASNAAPEAPQVPEAPAPAPAAPKPAPAPVAAPKPDQFNDSREIGEIIANGSAKAQYAGMNCWLVGDCEKPGDITLAHRANAQQEWTRIPLNESNWRDYATMARADFLAKYRPQ